MVKLKAKEAKLVLFLAKVCYHSVEYCQSGQRIASYVNIQQLLVLDETDGLSVRLRRPGEQPEVLHLHHMSRRQRRTGVWERSGGNGPPRQMAEPVLRSRCTEAAEESLLVLGGKLPLLSQSPGKETGTGQRCLGD